MVSYSKGFMHPGVPTAVASPCRFHRCLVNKCGKVDLFFGANAGDALFHNVGLDRPFVEDMSKAP